MRDSSSVLSAPAGFSVGRGQPELQFPYVLLQTVFGNLYVFAETQMVNA